MPSASKPLRAPAGLDARGRSLWRDITGKYLLREDERRILEGACRLYDELGRIEAALAEQPVMVVGSQGQSRVNPLFTEARNHRLGLQRLLSSMDIPEDADTDRSQRRSSNARAMAHARWGRRSG